MKTRYRTAAVVVGITFLWASQALAASPGWGGGRGRGWGNGPPAPARFDTNRPSGGPMWQRPGGPGPDRMRGAVGQRSGLTGERRGRLAQMQAWGGQFRQRMRGSQARGGRRNWQTGPWGRQPQGCPWMQPGRRRGPASFGSRSRGGGWGPAETRRPQGPAPMPRQRRFERADKDNDGNLTKEETGTSRGRAGQFQQGNRAVGPQGAWGGRGPAAREGRGDWGPQMRQGRQRGAVGPSADRPGAGRRGPGAEGPSEPRGPFLLKRIFGQADTNEDGLLSMAEIEAFQDKMNDRPGFPGR